ncbi:MAG: cytochrome c3 family protein [bacterium JZ-2024 1]
MKKIRNVVRLLGLIALISCQGGGKVIWPPDLTFPTSLHGTRVGKVTAYSAQNGGYEAVTGIPITNLHCLDCHAATYADGSPVNPATYQPSCRDCHITPGDTPSQAICLKCHGRQANEINLGFRDVHRDRGMVCMDCHTSEDVHGDGVPYRTALDKDAIKADCRTCHKEVVVNLPHNQHLEKVDCTACHTKSVITCNNCHFESMVQAGIRRPQAALSGFVLLLRNASTGKVVSGTFQTHTYNGKSFAVFAPYRSHAIIREGRACSECHYSANIREYESTGKIQLLTWDETAKKAKVKSGIIPVPPDWQTAFQLVFLTYTGDPAGPSDPTKWTLLKTQADLLQLFGGKPLTEEQMEALSKPQYP